MTDDERREKVRLLNEETADLFDTRPIVDTRKWYQKQYAMRGMKWPGPDPDPGSPRTYDEETFWAAKRARAKEKSR